MKTSSDLPPALSSMWRALKRGYAAEPWLLVVSFGLVLVAAVPDALLALWLALLASGVLEHDRTLVLVAAVGLAVSSTATWFLRVLSGRVQRRFRDRVTVALESHVAQLQASATTLEHHERPEYLDRLSMLRNQVFVLDHMYASLFSTCGFLLRLLVTLGLLASVHPALLLLALCALPTAWAAAARPGVERAVEERAAADARLARHLFVTATTAQAAKEVRVTGIGPELVSRRHAAFEAWHRPIARTRVASAAFHAGAWLLFGLSFVAAVVLLSQSASAAPADVLLVLAAGSRLSSYVGATVSEVGFLRGIWLDGSQRLAWLEDFVSAKTDGGDLAAPPRLEQGIRLEDVSFTYPGTERAVLQDVSLELRPGSVVALVGENGAGKTTLVKLLCKLYEPSAGRILVDGAPLSRISAASWRTRLAGAFQDFFRFELVARHSVGVGDLPRMDDAGSVTHAVERGGAGNVVEALPKGLDTQLGPTWPRGVDVSFGQWQKLALARSFMRREPILLVLDEPTAALDAETEHALFERYAAATHQVDGGNQGRETLPQRTITLLVSHRFSTVRMADLIVVLDGARVVETGTHDALMQKRGSYAELYALQASAYR